MNAALKLCQFIRNKLTSKKKNILRNNCKTNVLIHP